MKAFLILGAGRQGVAIADGLKRLDPSYHVALLDNSQTALDSAERGFDEYVISDEWIPTLKSRPWSVVISALPYRFNEQAAKASIDIGLRFLDLGGHSQTTKAVNDYAFSKKGTVATDQGLAPGLMNILAWDRVRFSRYRHSIDSVEIYCGGLPVKTPEETLNAYNYYPSFSAAGLVNEYLNEITILKDGRLIPIPGQLFVDKSPIFMIKSGAGSALSLNLEAFRTSGVTTRQFLFNMSRAGVSSVDYRTLRYPGHVRAVSTALVAARRKTPSPEKQRDLLAKILTNACEPPGGAFDDFIIGRVDLGKDGKVLETQDMIIVPQNGYTAMQVATGYSAATVASLMATGRLDGGPITYQKISEAGFMAEAEALNFLS